MLGFHFRCQLRVAWELLAPMIDQRARLLGCPAPHGALKPLATRVTISGTIDYRLRQGRTRYDYVLYDAQGLPVDVQLGLMDATPHIRFGVDESTRGEWTPPDTLEVSSEGLFIPEQRTVDGVKLLPAWFVAKIDLWRVLMQLADIAAGAALPPTKELAAAPGWQLSATTMRHESELTHTNATLSIIITPLIA